MALPAILAVPVFAAVYVGVTYVTKAKNKQQIEDGLNWVVKRLESLPMPDELQATISVIVKKIQKYGDSLDDDADLKEIKDAALAALSYVEKNIKYYFAAAAGGVKEGIEGTAEVVKSDISDALSVASEVLAGFAKSVSPPNKKKKKKKKKKGKKNK